MKTVALLYLAVGPGIALAVYLYYADKWEPEPKLLVLKAFLLGGLACFPTSYAEGVFESIFDLQDVFRRDGAGIWWQRTFYAFFGVALIEELCKFLFLKGFIYDDHKFSEPYDGIVYGGVVGCGFATVENLFYVLPLGQQAGVFRLFTAVPGHAFEGMLLGYFMGRAKFSLVPARELTRGLILVVFLHGVYDAAVFSRAEWALYLMFFLVFLGIYLALRAKKELEKHSAVIEFSTEEYLPLNPRSRQKPLLLKDIRNLLAEGKLNPEDRLIVKKTGRIKPIKELFSSRIVSQYQGLAKAPPRERPLFVFMVFYTLTLGLYFYFWFLRNYRNFRNYKRIKINPELTTLVLFILSTTPYFIYGVIQGPDNHVPAGLFPWVMIDGVVAAVKSAFLWAQLRVIRRFLKRRVRGTFRPLPVTLAFGVMEWAIQFLDPAIPYYLWITMGLVMVQGMVLVRVQRDLNAYWRREADRMSL